jgi:hypothetical protein
MAAGREGSHREDCRIRDVAALLTQFPTYRHPRHEIPNPSSAPLPAFETQNLNSSSGYRVPRFETRTYRHPGHELSTNRRREGVPASETRAHRHWGHEMRGEAGSIRSPASETRISSRRRRSTRRVGGRQTPPAFETRRSPSLGTPPHRQWGHGITGTGGTPLPAAGARNTVTSPAIGTRTGDVTAAERLAIRRRNSVLRNLEIKHNNSHASRCFFGVGG